MDMSLPTILLVAGIGALAYAWFGKPKKKHAIQTFGLVMLGLYFVNSMGLINLGSFVGAGLPAAVGPLQPVGITGAGVSCPTTLATTLKTRVRNPLNSSLNYIAAPLSYVGSDNKMKATDTGLSTTTGTWSTGAAITCGVAYTAKVVNSASFIAVSRDVGVLSGDIVYNEMEGSPSGQLVFWIGDSNFNNQTSGVGDGGDNGWAQDTTTTAQTFGAAAGASASYVLKAKVNSTAAQFGSDSLSTYVCADFDTAIYSKANGVIISGLQEVPVSGICSTSGYDKMWKLAGPLKANAGEYVWTVSVKNDLAAASNKDVKFYFVDEHFYTGIDGTIKGGTQDDNSADVGETNNYVTIDDN